MEYPALLEAGMHNITLSDMNTIFVAPFENPKRRKILLSRLESFVEKLQEISLDMEIWVDGSFATQKEHPGDIDLVVVCNEVSVNRLSDDKQKVLSELFGNQKTTKLRYECDAYFTMDDMHSTSYWRGLFGFDRDEHPKGIARLKIEANL